MSTSILDRTFRRHAYLVFIDEAGFMLAPLVRKTWAPRGCTPVIKVAAPHERISVVGAISISPARRRFAFHYHLLENNANFHGSSIAQFLDGLSRSIRAPITLLWDEIAIHRSKPVKDFLGKRRRIVVEEFPPHAPELNPVDNVWSYVKWNRLANYTRPNLAELRKRITWEFRRLQKRPNLLKSFFDHTGLTLDPVEPSHVL